MAIEILQMQLQPSQPLLNYNKPVDTFLFKSFPVGVERSPPESGMQEVAGALLTSLKGVFLCFVTCSHSEFFAAQPPQSASLFDPPPRAVL